MIHKDLPFDENTIEALLENDALGRNKFLSNLMGALIGSKIHMSISIDGRWGSGKTVIAKQLEYLTNVAKPTNYTNITSKRVADFQREYRAYYFNAWACDHHGDPLQALLLALLNDIYTEQLEQEEVTGQMDAAVKTTIKNGIKTLTAGIFDIDEINAGALTKRDLVSEVVTIEERRSAVLDIVDSLLTDGKRLVIIVDELDRCRPDFAVNLLEVIKHYYSSDKIVFIFMTNNRQLAETVKHHYGVQFDGYAYLDKLYDVLFDLPHPNMDHYLTQQLDVGDDSYWINMLVRDIVKQFSMSLRETNRYVSMVRFIQPSIERSSGRHYDLMESVTLYFFPLYAIALKIIDIEAYDAFIRGAGEEKLEQFFANSNIADETVLHSEDTEGRTAASIILPVYRQIVGGKDVQGTNTSIRGSYSVREMRQAFQSVLPILSSATSFSQSVQQEDS